MPTHNKLGRSRRLDNGWPEPAELGCVYTLHFARPLGNQADPRGRAQHYTGFSTRLPERLMEHWDGTCGVRLVVAFRQAGIPFAVVAVEHGVTRARENRLKLSSAARRCPICLGRGRTVDTSAWAATLLTGELPDQDQDRQETDHAISTASDRLRPVCVG